jgi:UDP-N-acetyl-D-mannosaminuronic acid dehydrogenase
VASSDKLVAGLHPATPGLIRRLYAHIVTRGTLHPTNSLTAEVVKVLENAYRDVRIAYAAEVARDCDTRGLDFFTVRDAANDLLAQTDAASGSPTAVPTGGLLVPTAGVGGHCLPKDGILLWWRAVEAGLDRSRSLILEARRINGESPAHVIEIAERGFGPIAGRAVALLGVAYRFDSEDTRNSPTLRLARLLADRACRVMLHDPHVAEHDQNLSRSGFASRFTHSLPQAVAEAELLIFCVGHAAYRADLSGIARLAPHARGVVDAANLVPLGATHCGTLRVAGIGRGSGAAPPAYIAAVVEGFRAVELGVANEVEMIAEFLNDRYARDEFNRISVNEVRRLAATCPTGCAIVAPETANGDGVTRFPSRLVARALVPDEARAQES